MARDMGQVDDVVEETTTEKVEEPTAEVTEETNETPIEETSKTTTEETTNAEEDSSEDKEVANNEEPVAETKEENSPIVEPDGQMRLFSEGNGEEGTEVKTAAQRIAANITVEAAERLKNVGINIKMATQDEVLRIVKAENSRVGWNKILYPKNKYLSEEEKEEIRNIITHKKYSFYGTDVVTLDSDNSKKIYLIDHSSNKEFYENIKDGDGFGVRAIYEYTNLKKENVDEIIRNIRESYNNDAESISNVLQSIGINARDMFGVDVYSAVREGIGNNALGNERNRENGHKRGWRNHDHNNIEHSIPNKKEVNDEVNIFLLPDRFNLVERGKIREREGVDEMLSNIDIANVDNIERSELAINKGLSGAFNAFFDGYQLSENPNVPSIIKDLLNDAEGEFSDITQLAKDNISSLREELADLEDEPGMQDETKKRIAEYNDAIYWCNEHKNDITYAPIEFFDNDGKYIGANNVNNNGEYLKSSDGTVYGWAEGNTITLTPEGINPNTPVHEYTHLWSKAVQKNNPALWERCKELAKSTEVWNEVMNDSNYTDIHGNEDAVVSEVLSRLTGRMNADMTVEEASKILGGRENATEDYKASLLDCSKSIINEVTTSY